MLEQKGFGFYAKTCTEPCGMPRMTKTKRQLAGNPVCLCENMEMKEKAVNRIEYVCCSECVSIRKMAPLI